MHVKSMIYFFFLAKCFKLLLAFCLEISQIQISHYICLQFSNNSNSHIKKSDHY